MTGEIMTAQLLLERLADELARLTAAATRLEGLISPVHLDPEAMVVAQSHDLISQTVAELEGFLRIVAPAFAGEREHDLHAPLATVRLSALAQPASWLD